MFSLTVIAPLLLSLAVTLSSNVYSDSDRQVKSWVSALDMARVDDTSAALRSWCGEQARTRDLGGSESVGASPRPSSLPCLPPP
jgi:hypothetical protein